MEEVRRIVNSTQHTLTSSRWQKMTDGINSTPLIIPAGVDNTAQLITYRLKAIEASNAVSSYVEEKSPLQKLQELVSNHLSNKWMYLIVLAVIAGIILLNIIFGLTMLVISLLVLVTPILSGIVLQLIYNKKAEAQLKNTYATLIEASSTVEATFTQQNNFIQNMYIRRRAENTTQHQRVMQNLDLALQMKLAELRSIVSTSEQDAKLLVADWNDPRWQQWTPFEVTVPVTRLGVWKVQERQEFPLIPALVACPSEENILFKAAGAAKNTALSAIQSLILRLLVMQPPGKVLFTFIDPVDLGQNVATFMQLTDDDEKLVNSKAWTEKQHIEKQLADLSEHMETIIQKYLRNQYNTIDDYNAIAGELAEPYRILVVIGFPNNFTEDAARRLISIAANGPRCGVSTLILMDTDQPQPHRFHVSELARFTNVIAWNGNGFIWEHEEIEGSKLLLDSPPPSGMFNYFLKYVGEKAKETHKVEVPFRRMVERIVPEYSWWADEHSTREEIRVPLGPAGATRYQYFRLGKGTAHHALVVGKTGAGKTNLLQALIIGLCLTYSANELELYLVDFKTVGFTPYANYKLPHARVVAIQSEREFGLSVLKGLFSELEERKRLFSRSSVQNIVQYRLVQPKARMPRILLLVDEFQEFFTHEDKIAKEAASLLDRLVRMGRAFGIHVMLCSQTLVGTHTLDRSTISQMDIRIAMQCEEADSRLILSEDNSEARLLSRPGEAIYNAENGAVAGNNRFQCAWLPDEELHVYLNAIQQLAHRYQYVPPKTQNIFDGSKNADINENHVFEHVLQAPTWPTTKLPVKIWLGKPVEMREPTHIQFHSQPGSNALIIGQQEEVSFGLLIAALLSLTAQLIPESARFYVLDFSPIDAAYAGYLEWIGQSLLHEVKIAKRRTFASVISEISLELEKRTKTDEVPKQSIYLLIHGLQRARDLRHHEDFSSPESRVLYEQFSTILREGPELKVHTLAWCDNVVNITRTLERGVLREFETRIAFQMSIDDSMTLIDSPLANQLGQHRALLFVEDKGYSEKFIPYELPSEEWLEQAIECIRRKI